jgi:acetate kinase
MTTPVVLVVNAGSSSLKLRLVARDDDVLACADLPAPDASPHSAPLESFVDQAGQIDAVGHRLVHGGAEFRDSTAVDENTRARLQGLADLAPLHNRPALAVLDLVRRLRPDIPHVACFDTTFHASLPDAAALYALPWDWIVHFGLRRYGFHGFSHRWASRRAAALLGRPLADLRLVTCHLGAGASLAAVEGGRSVDTTMGFTPNEGLVMATRSGSVDPGMLLWLIRHSDLSVDEVEHALEYESGVHGLARTSGDMRELIERAEGGDERSASAFGVYLHRLRAEIASMAAAMGGVDGIVFTGGVGENSAVVRREACRGIEFLGVGLDQERNASPGDGDVELSPPGARARVVLVKSREDLEIAGAVRAVMADG